MPQKREPLAPPKPEPFGAALKAAIRAEFGSGRAFAEAVGVSEGRVSQIVRGPEDVNARTLDYVLAPISSLPLQERVHAAWVRDFAPLPEPERSPMEPERAVWTAKDLWLAGNPKRALRLAAAQREFAEEPWAWHELSGLMVMTGLRLGRSSLALETTTEIERKARSDGDRMRFLAALWMRGLALRNSEHVPARSLNGAHEDALAFAETWEPGGRAEQELVRVKRMELRRDFALNVLAVHGRRPVPEEILQRALRSAEDALRMHDDPLPRCFALEVRARVEVALGQLFRAEETLEEAESLSGGRILELWEKSRIVRAKILLGRGARDEAAHELREVAERCFEEMNLHHHRVADQLLARLAAE